MLAQHFLDIDVEEGVCLWLAASESEAVIRRCRAVLLSDETLHLALDIQ